MTLEQVYTKELKKGDIVLNYGAKFEVTEDAYNRGQQLEHLSKYTIENNENDIWIGKCKYIEGAEENDWLLRNYDTFQSNSKIKLWNKIK